MTGSLPSDPHPDPADPKDVPSDSRGWAVASHLLPLASIYILGSLFIWLIKRDEDPFVEQHSREALNFQLSMLIYLIISAILIIVLIGIVLIVAIAIFQFVMAIIAAVKAANGEMYHYPLAMRMVKPRVDR
jgi:uncharacterized Tic20 family protein